MEYEKIKYNKIEKISISFMQSIKELKDSKIEFIIKGTAVFNMPKKFYENCTNDTDYEDLTKKLLESMYLNLSENINDKCDYVGMWIDYNNKKYENSIKIETIDSIEEYGSNDINPIYEFFKMTIKTNIT